mgnify:FL=1
MTNERKDLQDLCSQLEDAYLSIARILATKKSKHTFVTVPFEREWQEYELHYSKHVTKAAEPAKEREQNELLEYIRKSKKDWLDSGKTEEEYDDKINKWLAQFKSPHGSSFDPLKDNPATLVSAIYSFLYDFISDGFFEDDYYDKALGAWHFYEKSIGLDLAGIYKRWKNSPELFIPQHITVTNTAPLVDLYNEAIRTYVFGNREAAVALCRALLEHILQKYYKARAEKLKDIIAIAEQKFPNIKKLRLERLRRLANNILHEYENIDEIEDTAIFDFLKTIKYLVQNVPQKKTKQ